MKTNLPGTISTVAIALALLATPPAPAQEREEPPARGSGGASSSLLVTHPPDAPASSREAPHALRSASMFAITPAEPKRYKKHDLVQIIVRESSRARRSHELETSKEWEMDGAIQSWPDFRLSDLLQLRLAAGSGASMPALDMDFTKEFDGDGDYERRDEVTDRLTAEVIEVLPNGSLVLEARTSIRTDDEQSLMRVTGICRPEDISAINTIMSTQIHDLVITRNNTGELRKTNEKGLIAKVFEFVFAF